MHAIDFGNSYLVSREEGNSVRIQLEAACTIVESSSGERREYYLIAPCRGENTHADQDLIKVPGYEWVGVWGKSDHVTHRKHLLSQPDYPISKNHLAQHGESPNAKLVVRRFPEVESVTDIHRIIELSLGTAPMISRTEITDEGKRFQAIMEYPIRTMNVLESNPRFQVDTGPLIIPDFEKKADHETERFDIAFVVYNRWDQAEFVLRKPAPVHKGNKPLFSVTDYSEIRVLPARNELLFATSAP